MKKLYFLITATLVVATAHGQFAAKKAFPKNKISHESVVVKGNAKGYKGAVIWENDFSNPTDWVMDNEAGNNDNWVITTAGPSGDYKINKIVSTSGGNFALFDSDKLCSGDQNANLSTVNPVNLSAYPAVSLQFEQYYRRYQDKTYIEVSSDNVNWDTYEVNTELGVNDFVTSNPTVYRLDISPSAAGKATVWIRFNYIGGCDYAWMVDDVKLVETPNKDMAITSIQVDNGGPTQFFEYGEQPLSQSHLLITRVSIRNKGGQTQNATVNIDVKKDGASFGTYYNAVPVVIEPGKDSTFEIEAFTPTAVGNYQFLFTVSSSSSDVDDDLANNTMKDSLYITNGIWSDKECQQYKRRAYNFEAGGTGPNYADVTVSQAFQVFNDGDMAYSITTVFPDLASAGFSADQPIYVDIHRFNTNTYTGEFTSADYTTVGSVNEFNVGSADITGTTSPVIYKTLRFADPVSLTQGLYVVTIHALGGEYVFNAAMGSPDNKDRSGALLGDISSTSPSNFYPYGDVAPFIKLNLDANVGVKKTVANNFFVGQNQPNPFNTNSTVSYQLKEAGAVNFEVMDVTGKVVKSVNKGVQGAGMHAISLSAADFNAGVYFYTLTINGVKVSKKMIITE